MRGLLSAVLATDRFAAGLLKCRQGVGDESSRAATASMVVGNRDGSPTGFWCDDVNLASATTFGRTLFAGLRWRAMYRARTASKASLPASMKSVRSRRAKLPQP